MNEPFRTDEEFYTWWDKGYKKAMAVDWMGWSMIALAFVAIAVMGIAILFTGGAL